jgi:toxin ParE1/3/4
VRVVLTASAEADVDEASQWYEQRSAGLGAKFLAQVSEALLRVADNPELYPEVHNGVRRAPVRRFPYSVFYRTRGDRLEIIAVFQDRRSPSRWQRRI